MMLAAPRESLKTLWTFAESRLRTVEPALLSVETPQLTTFSFLLSNTFST